jgi:hypothetical protein
MLVLDPLVSETPTGTMSIMTGKGDVKSTWDSSKPEEVEAARRQFNALRKQGYIAFAVRKDGEKAEILSEFDAGLEAMILAPPMKGG